MKNRFATIAATSALILLGIVLFKWCVSRYVADADGVLHLSFAPVIGAFTALLAIGAGIGVVAKRSGMPLGEPELKAATGGVVGATFVGGLCLSGVCIPAATLGTVLTLPLLVPVLIGLKLTSRTRG